MVEEFNVFLSSVFICLSLMFFLTIGLMVLLSVASSSRSNNNSYKNYNLHPMDEYYEEYE